MRDGLKQSRVGLNGTARFRKSGLRHRRIELQSEALEENRMINAALRATPAQDAISQDELHAFRFAIDATVERIKRLEELHRRTSGLFRFQPLIAQKLPTLQDRAPRRIVRELHSFRLCAILGFLQSLLEREGI